ncbi:MAG: hypothetical protein FWB91_12945 [Defluviitaleaceae bacterium]|nr:hypothetical protein [Defluviitaleaceae bacterium]
MSTAKSGSDREVSDIIAFSVENYNILRGYIAIFVFMVRLSRTVRPGME